MNGHAPAIFMLVNVSKTMVITVHNPCEQRQAVLPDGETLEDVQIPRFDCHCKRPGQELSCPLHILSPAILSLVAAGNIAAYKGQDLTCSGSFDSAIRLRDAASTENRRTDTSGP